jgi:hypothetical protein
VAVNAHKVITALAVRYLDAARVLHKNSTTADDFWGPQNHLFAMAAELALKAFLERAEVSEKELKRRDIRHSLNALLMLAIERGLRTNRDVAEVLMEMDGAHSSHAFRYVPRPEEGEVVTVYSARPASAYPAIQQLLDQCADDPASVRTQTKFPDEWPPARLPVHPVTSEQLHEWIAEKQRLREFASTFDMSRPVQQDWFFNAPTSFFVAGFVRDENGGLRQEFGPRQMPSEQEALDAARAMARSDYAGVIAWKHTAQFAGGRDATTEVLYQVGEVPVLE